MSKETLNVFISHYNQDEGFIPKLKSLLATRHYNVRDSSIDSTEPNNATNPDYIKSLIRPKIQWAGQVLVLIGPKTSERPWINWEIEYAAQFGNKRVIGIFLRGATDADIPESLLKYGDALVPWNSRKLEAAIDGENIWHDSQDQRRRDYDDDIERTNC